MSAKKGYDDIDHFLDITDMCTKYPLIFVKLTVKLVLVKLWKFMQHAWPNPLESAFELEVRQGHNLHVVVEVQGLKM